MTTPLLHTRGLRRRTLRPRPLATMVAQGLDAASARLQQTACRNAMVATTALAERRREREDVADYLRAALDARHAATSAHAG